jgi:GntR family transcriptional regulator
MENHAGVVVTAAGRSPQPRYRAMADRLRARIVSGKLQPGDSLPTEMELCAAHQISRHTAREALRLLADDGLIVRRRGAGTVVAAWRNPVFAQTLNDFESILQYAHETHFELRSYREASAAMLRESGLAGAYRQISGLRRVGVAPPLAHTVILVRTALAPTAETVRGLTISLSEWIETTHKVSVANVLQRIEAVAVGAAEARGLGVEPGTAALLTARRYLTSDGDVMLVSTTVHPAGRFAYEIKLDRAR